MQIMIPNVSETLESLMAVESTFDGITRQIRQWVSEHRTEIKKNKGLIENNRTGENDILILNLFLTDLLVRAIKGEMGKRVSKELHKTIKTKADLVEANYCDILKNSNYRWGVEDGAKVISDVVHHVHSVLKWNWSDYIERAEREKKSNYPSDPILKIRNISFKLRDLALSNFSPYYAAFDLHVTRVLTRIGWLNYGFPFLANADFEMGNNPGNGKNYLFLHRLFIALFEMTKREYTPVDLDRIFWHFGKSICGAKSKCNLCPIAAQCPTGRYRKTRV